MICEYRRYYKGYNPPLKEFTFVDRKSNIKRFCINLYNFCRDINYDIEFKKICENINYALLNLKNENQHIANFSKLRLKYENLEFKEMKQMNIEISGSNVGITSLSENKCLVNISDVDVDEIIDLIKIKDFINRVGVDNILEEIDEKEASKFYGWDNE